MNNEIFGQQPPQLQWIEPSSISETVYDCKGEDYLNKFHIIRKIIANQFSKKISKGIKGFVLHGPSGTGKTTIGRVLSKSLGYPLLFIDGADVAHHLYGESEKRVKQIFEEASKRKSIILIDDAESVFPDREWSKGQSWHFAQNNMLLHTLDNIDTSKTIVIMTTNKYNLLDTALKDRLYNIEFEIPKIEVLAEIATKKCSEFDMKSAPIVKEMNDRKNEFKSVRDVEKFIIEKYVEGLE